MKVIREHSQARTWWDTLGLILIVTSILIVPYQFAFIQEINLNGLILVYLIDLFFISDLVLNSRTTFHIAGREVTEKNILSRHYFKTRFSIDLIASIPIDAIFLFWPDIEIADIPIVLWIRLLRLSRLYHLLVILRRWQAQNWLNSGYLRIGRFFSVIMIFSHLIACSWYLSSDFSGFPANSWIMLEGIESLDPGPVYLRSLYWTITTMTTVGFGDITPNLNYEYVFTIVVMILGASIYAFIIGNIASMISHLNAKKTSYWNRINSVKIN